MQQLLKDKKKMGILIILAIVIVTFLLLYLKSGFRELKKNDNESIFVESEGQEISEVKSDNGSKGKRNDTSSKETAVSIKDKNIVVEIKGEVKKPDVYILDENSIIKDLIEKAGGLTENADLSNINRAKKLQNHELVFIANKNEITKESQSTNSINNNKESSNKKVNINSATLEDLKTIKGVGNSKAKSIIEYREQNGGFKTVEDIKNVTGIGEKMFEKIKEQIEI